MDSISRRSFVKASVPVGLSAFVPFSRVRGANDDIRVAVVGLNNQGAN
ncbi:MAG TPA: gfo/Idh/MocA family oxidoreductase, partial [Phycisphaerales bacterium]|nr:gfo/Idh/MocA family oxidoreductase [Phycisphaerales bacterium]